MITNALKGCQTTLRATGLDREHTHHTGGVGVATMNPIKYIKLELNTNDFAEVCGAGRVGIVAVR